MFKKIFSIIMAVVFSTNTASITTAATEMAEGREERPLQLCEWNLGEDGNLELHMVSKEVQEGSNTVKAAYSKIADGICNFDEEIAVETDLDQDTVVRLFKSVTTNPEVFWAPNSGKIGKHEGGYTIYVHYYMDKISAVQTVHELDRKAKSIFSKMSDSDSEADISSKVSAWISDNVEYDITQDVNNFENSSIVGGLLKGKALCGGYSNTYSYLMARAGYETAYCTGDYHGTFHAWNERICDNAVVGVDTTHASGNKALYLDFNRNSEQWAERNKEQEVWYCPTSERKA